MGSSSSGSSSGVKVDLHALTDFAGQVGNALGNALPLSRAAYQDPGSIRSNRPGARLQVLGTELTGHRSSEHPVEPSTDLFGLHRTTTFHEADDFLLTHGLVSGNTVRLAEQIVLGLTSLALAAQNCAELYGTTDSRNGRRITTTGEGWALPAVTGHAEIPVSAVTKSFDPPAPSAPSAASGSSAGGDEGPSGERIAAAVAAHQQSAPSHGAPEAATQPAQPAQPPHPPQSAAEQAGVARSLHDGRVTVPVQPDETPITVPGPPVRALGPLQPPATGTTGATGATGTG